MITLQKALITTSVVVLAGAVIYEARHAARLREQNQTLMQQQAPLTEQIDQLQQERAQLQNNRDALRSDLAALKQENGRLNLEKTELLKLRGEVGQLRQRLAELKETEATAPATGLASMMSDPASKEYNRQVILKGLKSRYAALFRELKLTPDQIEQFAQLFSGLYMKFGEITTASRQGAQGNYNMAEIEGATRAAKADFEQQLVQLLGESGVARFKVFSAEIPARTVVQLLNDQLGASPISAEQRARLLQIVDAEPYELTHGIEGDLNKAFFGSPQQVDQYIQRIEQSNQHIVQEASDILSPDQLSALATVLTNSVSARIAQAAAFGDKQ